MTARFVPALGSALLHAGAVAAMVALAGTGQRPDAPAMALLIAVDVVAPPEPRPVAAAAPIEATAPPPALPTPAVATEPATIAPPPHRAPEPPRPVDERPHRPALAKAVPAPRRPVLERPAPSAPPAQVDAPAAPALAADRVEAGATPPAASQGAAGADGQPIAMAALASPPAASQGAPPASPVAYGGNPKPVYPPLARERGLEGRVVLRAEVGADGSALSVTVAQSSGHAILDRAARDAVQRWRFTPARVDGVPVAGAIDVPVVFRQID